MFLFTYPKYAIYRLIHSFTFSHTQSLSLSVPQSLSLSVFQSLGLSVPQSLGLSPSPSVFQSLSPQSLSPSAPQPLGPGLRMGLSTVEVSAWLSSYTPKKKRCNYFPTEAWCIQCSFRDSPGHNSKWTILIAEAFVGNGRGWNEAGVLLVFESKFVQTSFFWVQNEAAALMVSYDCNRYGVFCFCLFTLPRNIH